MKARFLAALAALIVWAAPTEAGIVILKNGEVLVGRIVEGDVSEQNLTIRWPYGERTNRGMVMIPRFRVRWFDRAADQPTSAYWEAFGDAPIDERWLPAFEAWKKERGEVLPESGAPNPLGKRPAWVGPYSDGEVRLTLRRSPDGFGGTLEVGGAVYRLSGPAPEGGKSFRGEFWRVDERHAFTAVFAKDGRLVLTSGGEVYELSRQALLTERLETDAEEAPASRPASDQGKAVLPGVKAGQRYHFRMEPAPGTVLNMVWEVEEVISDRELKYSLTTFMNGKQIGEPTSQTWSIPEQGANAPAKVPPVETIKVAGRTWSCWRVESAGISTWCPQKDGKATWPPFVRQERDGKITSELSRIEEPSSR